MRRLTQFVAGMLVAFTAMPALGVAPCQQAAHPMKCCQTECPMMTKASGTTVINGMNLEMAKPVCCAPSSHRAVPLAEQQTTENRTDPAMLHSHALDAIIAVAEQRELKSLHEGPPVFRPSRTALCTFLI